MEIEELKNRIINDFKFLKDHFKKDLKERNVDLVFIDFDPKDNEFANTTEVDEHNYEVQINNRELVLQLNYYFWREILMHEFSHALAKFQVKRPHTNKWGVAYARVYRALME